MMSAMTPSESDDVEVIARLSLGDLAALGLLYDRHADAVLRYAWSRLRTMSDAQEVLQDTFVTAWDRRSRVRALGGSALPWLLATAKNHSRNLARRNTTRRSRQLNEASEASREVRGELDWINDAVDRLGPVDRRICELCLVEGYTYDEAARALGLSASTVGKRLQRARARLRKVALDNEN